MRYELEIQALLVKAKRSLCASENLMENGDYDFSISRTYYSMFYLLKGFRERQIGDYETLNLPLLEDAEELNKDAKIFLETTEMYLRKVGYKFQ